MTQETVINLAKEALSVALLVSAPMLGFGMLVGIVISVFQATTQIQEQTLTFVPKIITVMLALLVFAPWMLNVLTQFTQNLFLQIPNFVY